MKAAASDFANTKDTLCYATNDNQKATLGALEEGGADLVVVVGGYNSSNTTHIVEICEEHKPTFFIRNELEWEENGSLNHFNIVTKKRENYPNFLRGEPSQMPEIPTILITSGASCPDASMERVLLKILEKFPESKDVESVLTIWES